jgi:AcrR family transcriptional regulator
MDHDPSERAAGSAGSATRQRILDGASALFYAHGIRRTSADRIIEQVGTTKVTFYRHFRTKDDLVVAYLERSAAQERAGLDQAREGRDALDALREIATGIGRYSCMPGFRGCAFINAAAEIPDGDHPVRVVVDAHRRWTRDLFTDLAAEAGVADPQAVGGQLMMLRDGAMVGGYLGEPETIGTALAAACAALIEAGRD